MSEQNKPTDKVISYTVSISNGVDANSYTKLEKALADGYRVKDVICTPTASAAAVVVTVVLQEKGVYHEPH